MDTHKDALECAAAAAAVRHLGLEIEIGSDGEAAPQRCGGNRRNQTFFHSQPLFPRKSGAGASQSRTHCDA
jgi:hypothetical protein